MRKPFGFCSVLILFISIIVTVTNCYQSKNPLGVDHEIRVVADSTIWQQAEPVLSAIFEKVEYTPQPEKIYKIVKADLNNFKRFKNIIFLSTLDAQDEISKSINSNLSEDAQKKVAAGSIIFVKRNEWANYQMIMFLIGKNLPTLLTGMDEQQSEIFFQFDNYWNEFHKNILYHYKEKKDIAQHLLKNYGWTIRVPNDFVLETQSAKDRFVMFHRKIPFRWLSIYWVEATDPTIITKAWCIARRNEMGQNFYQGESLEEKYEEVHVEELIFLNRRALKLKGLWKNADDAVDPAGGPFRLYCFFDEPTERIYFIDMHLFSPELKNRKLHYFRQMEIIANTFKTNLETSAEEL